MRSRRRRRLERGRRTRCLGSSVGLNRIEGLSKPLAIALTEVRWLNLKAVWFPGQKLIQERLRYLGNNLRSLVGQVGERNRVETLRRCHTEIEKLLEPECFGRFVSAEFKNSI